MTALPIHDAALRAWCRNQVAKQSAPLCQSLGLEPVGFFCETCGTRLDKADRPCPMGCGR